FVDILRKIGYYVYYFEIPPASVLQYIKEPTFHKRGLLNFFCPPVRTLTNLSVFAFPPIIPASRFESGYIRAFNTKRFIHRIRKDYYSLVRMRKKKVVAIVVTPYWFDIIKELNFSLLCYDCIDDVKVFCKEKHLNYFIGLQSRLIEKSDLIIISAQKLKDDILAINSQKPIAYIPNGVAFDFFVANKDNPEITNSLKYIKRPIIGFVGAIFNWIDIALIKKTAETFSDCSVVLVGPVQDIKIPLLPNLHYLGVKPFSDIPAIINCFDVCLIPFVAGEVSDKVDPIKVYEYLALGKPVVAINLPELKKVASLIYLAQDENDFINAIRKALNENSLELKSLRIQFAQKNSWEQRVEKLIDVVSNCIIKRESPGPRYENCY
ncbi:MAG: glycosyltransferase, partial [candidate division WOR-3 bacterium]|nr:glycosyltransferase [candidate division WOR-3 bacterium]